MAMKGKDRHIKRLRTLAGPGAARTANRIVFVGADMIRAEAHQSISRGSVSGKGHVPSVPGEPPNRDTGNLQAHLETTNPRPLVAEVRSEAEYAAPLEFGTSKMAARPYIRPARDAKVPEIQRLFASEMGKLVKRSGT
jgi:HK97 gp10 family phage protein